MKTFTIKLRFCNQASLSKYKNIRKQGKQFSRLASCLFTLLAECAR